MTFFIAGIKKIRNPFILFFPFLLIYCLVIIILHSPSLVGDESRYIYFANNLLQGFYSPNPPDINLWNGPGYPIFLVPFLAFKIPLIYATLANAVLYYLSVVLLFKVIEKNASFKVAFWTAFFFAVYQNAFQDMLLKCTEILTTFLITLFLFLVEKIFNGKKSNLKYIVFAGVVFGYLILTKILFAYVLVALFAICIILWGINKKSKSYFKRAVLIMVVAFITITPYLIYTYNLTGKIFYLGNSGGMSLYWMSNPNSGEYGDWFDDYYFVKGTLDENTKILKKGNFQEVYEPRLKENHQEDYRQILKYTGVQRDSVYKQLAIKNIINNHKTFIRNYLSNWGRLIFSYPFSYTLQSNKTLLRIPFSGFLFVIVLFIFIPTILNWKKLAFSLQFSLIFLFIYLGLTSILSAYTRMFTVIVPIILFWIAYILPKIITVKDSNSYDSDGVQ